MIHMSLRQAAQSMGAELIEAKSGHGQDFTGVAIDSRRVEPGMLFAALPGERVDGHNFVTDARQAGAAAIVCSRAVEVDLPQLLVENVQTALGRLAAAWREQMPAKVIGITGSNGKTTTKEMLTSILQLSARVLSTKGNYNNELGVPLTLFGLNRSHEYAVLEMGAGKAGDIRYLAAIAKPEAGLITNVGPAHLDGFGDEEGVARAKGEMYSALPADGFAVLNMDEPWVSQWLALKGTTRHLGFGKNPEAQVRLDDSVEPPMVMTPAGDFELRLDLPGAHNRMNALAACAVALSLGIGWEQIQQGLARAHQVPGRLCALQAKGGWMVIDDTYNANPASLYAALQVLAARSGERWLVLGDMLELGPSATKMHAEMGEAAADMGVTRLFTLGPLSQAASEAFGPGALHFDELTSLAESLNNELHPGVVCLVKGSRSMHMEQVVNAIVNGHNAAEVA